MSDSKPRSHRRGISFGEIIGFAALVVSALGLWITWQSTREDKPTRVVEQRLPIALTLRGTAERDGRELVLAPVEPGHALVSLTLTIGNAPPIEIASDGRLDADDVEAAIKDQDRDRKGAGKMPVRIAARYVEAGAEQRGGGTYVLRYRWEGGGLFGGRSLRLVGLSR